MSSKYSSLSLPIDIKRDHIQGPDTAPITLVEYLSLIHISEPTRH